jgi:hypothetical protein
MERPNNNGIVSDGKMPSRHMPDVNHQKMIKKLIGIVIGLLPFGILGAIAYSDDFPITNTLTWLGYLLLVLGAFISFLNFYLSFIRVPLFRKMHPKAPDPKYVSGIPLFGALAPIALSILNKSPILFIIVFLTLLADTGGIQWLVIAVWKDESFWNHSDV